MAVSAISVVTIITGFFLTNAIHNYTSDWGINFLEHFLGTFESVLWCGAVFSDNQDFVDDSGHNDGVSYAVAWCAIKDNDIEFGFKLLDKDAVFLGAEELAWVWRIGAAGNHVEISDAGALDIFGAFGNIVGK